MTTVQLAKYLVEATGTEEGEEIEQDVKIFVDRMLLRFFSFPAVISYLYDLRIKDREIELDFYKMPDEAMTSVKKLIGIPEIETFKFNRNEHEHLGLRFEVPEVEKKKDGIKPGEDVANTGEQISGEDNPMFPGTYET